MRVPQTPPEFYGESSKGVNLYIQSQLFLCISRIMKYNNSESKISFGIHRFHEGNLSRRFFSRS